MVVSYNDGQSRWPNLTYSGENCGGPLISQVWHTDAAPSTTTGSWCIAQKINNASTDTSEILNPNEQFILAIQMPYTTTPNTQFTVVLMPPEGAALTVTRTVPASITPVSPILITFLPGFNEIFFFTCVRRDPYIPQKTSLILDTFVHIHF